MDDIDTVAAGRADARVACLAAAADETGELEGRVLARARRFVELETPSGDAVKAAMLAEELARELGAAGAQTELLDAPGWGRHVRARVAGSNAGAAPLFVLGHLDTVHPVGTLESRPFRIESGRADGPGIFDMKAPLAVLAEALALLRDAGATPPRPVRVLVTCDEEVGSPTSRALIEADALGAAAALVLEPPLPGGAAKTARKGVATYRLRVIGRAAHAGIEPERGVNAIVELSRQIVRVHGLADSTRGTTLNVGLVGGGSAGNVVPGEAWANIDVRYIDPAEGRRVDAALRALTPTRAGARVIVDGGENRPPLVRTEGVIRLFEHAHTLARDLGFVLEEGATGGASDGCFTAALGIPTLDGLGVDGGGAHAADEHILIADLPLRVALLCRLLETL